MSNRIENYAMIGNGRSAALVGVDGSIDWLCLPTFSDAACFAALLGSYENGCWAIAPVGDFRAARRYRGDTMVLETTFTTADGSVATLVDFMPRPPVGDDCPPINLVRIVRGVNGTVRLRSDLALRFDYGKSHPWVRHVDPTTVTATAGSEAIVIRAGVPLRGGRTGPRPDAGRPDRDRRRAGRGVRDDLLPVAPRSAAATGRGRVGARVGCALVGLVGEVPGRAPVP